MGAEIYPCCPSDNESHIREMHMINCELKQQLLHQKKAYHQLRVQNQHKTKKIMQQWNIEQRQQQQQMHSLTEQNQELQQKLKQKQDASQSVSDSIDFIRIN